MKKALVGKNEIIHEAFDLDQGIVSTFLTLFTDPKKVLTNPDKFTRPWKYATYVVSTSCVFTWFVIHSFVDDGNDASFWLVPKRMVELLTGFQSFYENTQPLKRLVLGGIALYVALTIFFSKEMKQISLSSLCLYLLGHSVFLVFLLQTITVVIVADWYQSVVSIVAMMVHILYLTYAIVRVLSPVRWSAFFKGVGVLIVVYALYNFASTRLVYGVYYKILHRSGMIFRTAPDVRIAYTEKPSTTVEANEPVEYKMERILDSLRIVVDCAHSDAGEVSKIILSAWVKRKQLWSMPLFEKTRRYSPDPREVLVDIDSASHTAFVFYRIANDTNANIQIMATDVVTGLLKFRTSLQPASDDLHITDIAMDSDFVYLCGSTQYKFGNFDLGMIVMINKSTGIVNLREIGSTSFASWTSFQKISVLPKSIEVAERRNYRWLFLFTKSSSALWTIQKDELVAITKK